MAAAAAVTRSAADDRVNVMALREMTDDSGGRTEIVRDPRDLDPAVASIADELSQQYYLGYPSPGYKRRPLAHHPRRSERSLAAGARAQRLHRHTVSFDEFRRTFGHLSTSSFN